MRLKLSLIVCVYACNQAIPSNIPDAPILSDPNDLGVCVFVCVCVSLCALKCTNIHDAPTKK